MAAEAWLDPNPRRRCALPLQLLTRERIHDRKLLVMIRRVAAEGEPAGVFAFDLDEELFVLGAEALKDVRIHDDFELVHVGVTAERLVQRSLELDAHGHGTLYFAAAIAVRARFVDCAGDALLGALPGHLHEAKR